MSVTFSVPGLRTLPDGREAELNVANANARELLAWLSLLAEAEELYGQLPARDLAARCRRRLWPEERNEDPGIPPETFTVPGGPTVHHMGRRPGYLPMRTRELLALAEAAGDGVVTFS